MQKTTDKTIKTIDKLIKIGSLIGIGILIILFLINLFSYKHLPSPLYGGDIYRDRGFIQSIVIGFKPWQDGYYLNELQYYNYLGFFIIATIVKLYHIPIETTMLIFSFLYYILIICGYFLVGKFVTKDDSIAFLIAFLSAILFAYPNSKLATLSISLIPFFMLFLFLYKEKKDLSYNIIAGVILAVIGLIYGATYAGLMVFYLLWTTIEFISLKKWKIWYGLLISLMIPLLCFYLPLYLHYGSYTPNPVYRYGDLRIELYSFSRVIIDDLKLFFNYKNPIMFVIGIIAFIGLLSTFYKNDKKQDIIKKYFFFNYIAKLHHYITRPLIKRWFFPFKMNLSSSLFPVLVANGISFIKNKKIRKIIAIVLVILLLIYTPFKVKAYNNSRWVQYGKVMDESTKNMYKLGEYLKENMKNNETILAYDETSFAIAALSGKKVVITRRTHASYYVDIDKRIADTAIILYGNNNSLRKALIKKYKISYFYEDYYLHTAPLNTRKEFKEYLQSNGVQFYIKNITLDPAQTLETGTIEERIIIPPQNISNDFRNITYPLQVYQINGKTMGVLYKIK